MERIKTFVIKVNLAFSAYFYGFAVPVDRDLHVDLRNSEVSTLASNDFSSKVMFLTTIN